jgi:hypothetical protein
MAHTRETNNKGAKWYKYNSQFALGLSIVYREVCINVFRKEQRRKGSSKKW